MNGFLLKLQDRKLFLMLRCQPILRKMICLSNDITANIIPGNHPKLTLNLKVTSFKIHTVSGHHLTLCRGVDFRFCLNADVYEKLSLFVNLGGNTKNIFIINIKYKTNIKNLHKDRVTFREVVLNSIRLYSPVYLIE